MNTNTITIIREGKVHQMEISNQEATAYLLAELDGNGDDFLKSLVEKKLDEEKALAEMNAGKGIHSRDFLTGLVDQAVGFAPRPIHTNAMPSKPLTMADMVAAARKAEAAMQADQRMRRAAEEVAEVGKRDAEAKAEAFAEKLRKEALANAATLAANVFLAVTTYEDLSPETRVEVDAMLAANPHLTFKAALYDIVTETLENTDLGDID